MGKPKPLPAMFFDRDPTIVAPELLGKLLIRDYGGHRLTGMITETEAYAAFNDSACHASRGRTTRNGIMFGPPGHAYVYFIYGLHHMLNVVTEPAGTPSAVLIRRIAPFAGQQMMRKLRASNHHRNLTNGPARLCQALAIDKRFNQWDLTLGRELWFENHLSDPLPEIRCGPRVGIDYAKPADRQRPWRFWISPEDFE